MRKRSRPHTTIDRRTLWKLPLFGAPLLFGLTRPAAVAALSGKTAHAARLSSGLVSQMLKALFGYAVPPDDAEAIARSADATISAWQRIASLHTAPVEPPFDYPALVAEATHQAKTGASDIVR